jgi:hypothetical protein
MASRHQTTRNTADLKQQKLNGKALHPSKTAFFRKLFSRPGQSELDCLL